MSGKILISDPIADDAINDLKANDFELDQKTGLSEAELAGEIGKYDAIVVRSGTTVTKRILDAGDKLKIIVRAGVGLDNIDLDYAEEVGVEVQNTPEANSNSVAELAIGHMINLARNMNRGAESLRQGKWIKGELRGTELLGKTLGVIGIGRIGDAAATGIARQPEAAGNIQTASIILAALIEGVALFGLVITLLYKIL